MAVQDVMGDRQWPDPRGWEALTQAEAERDAWRREKVAVRRFGWRLWLRIRGRWHGLP